MVIILYLYRLIQSLLAEVHSLKEKVKSLESANLFLVKMFSLYPAVRQRRFDDSRSPKYQKFKTDILPRFQYLNDDWDWKSLVECYQKHYGKSIHPVKRRGECCIPKGTVCPHCGAPMEYLYQNNGSKGQLLCSVCGTRFSPDRNRYHKDYILRCPYCGHALVAVKDRKHFRVHKCVNQKCSYYLHNLQKVDKQDLSENYGKWKYKLHYIYREFSLDFFKIDLDSLPSNASSLRFSKHSLYVMSLCLTFHVNLQLSLRKTAQALNDLYGIQISHQQVANYAMTAAILIKPFVDHFDYSPSNELVGDETYIKVRGRKSYVWFIMDAVKRSILGYQVSESRDVGPCILTMRMAFRNFREKLPKGFRFVADGYSAYPLAAQQFHLQYGEPMHFDITQVLGLTNEDEVSAEFRPLKQLVERLNRTFKSTYRVKCGYDNYDGANYNVALWVAYYNFLRPHQSLSFHVLNRIPMLDNAGIMPNKWQLLMYLGQKTIISLQKDNPFFQS